MELTLCVVGGYMATVLMVGLLRGWHRGPTTIKTAPRPRTRQVVWLNRNTFKVVD